MNEMKAGSMAQSALCRELWRAGAAHPFLREPIEKIPLISDSSVSCLATDSAHIFYREDSMPDKPSVEHLLMHCVFRHFLLPKEVIRPLWDLACDISAEFLRSEFFPAKGSRQTRMLIADILPENVDPRIAGDVYRALSDLFEDDVKALFGQFERDDHRYWYAPPTQGQFDSGYSQADAASRANSPSSDGNAYEKWKAAAAAGLWPLGDELPGGLSATGKYGLTPGSREEKMLLREDGKYDFSAYLRRFSATREEIKLNTGEFDYIPYYYGFARYGNLPLIEPLETVESRKVEELIIAIDTSGSCSRPIVERFLAEIESILMRHDAFFTRMNVHIIQCDSAVQSHAAIHSLEEWKEYRENLAVKGRGGTNFTPVFALVEKLRESGALKNLKGLMYFTDGDGAYPQRETPYETAFVFTTRKALERKIPNWIIPLCLERPYE